MHQSKGEHGVEAVEGEGREKGGELDLNVTSALP